MGGMITATSLAVLFVPVFFVVVRKFFKGSERQRRFYAHEAPTTGRLRGRPHMSPLLARIAPLGRRGLAGRVLDDARVRAAAGSGAGHLALSWRRWARPRPNWIGRPSSPINACGG